MKREHQKQKEHKHEMNGVAPGDDALSVQKKVALRAYELYLQRGGMNGHEVEDWLQAEREVVQEERH